MKANPQLSEFLFPYDKSIQELAIELRNFVVDLIPETNELIWDNYNAVAIAYSKSEKLKDAFCHIALYGKHVNFGFNRGAELIKSDLKLEGKGKMIRHIKVTSFNSFPKELVAKKVYEAVGLSEKINPDLILKNKVSKSIIISISEKKIRPKK